uniref:Fibronectin type-III domain-containing protein n=1 Tax=Zonotrichia albicollis TaxID=44394 RepID=A0A8D2N577_ZONAL
MKNSLLAAIFLLVRGSCRCSARDSPFCRQLTDWDNELVCYKELSEDLTCTWLPVPSAANTVNYTVYLKWNKIRKLFQRNTSSPSITIERKNLYIERFATIWIAVNYDNNTCAKGRNISVLPSKAGKCLSPSNINAYQITNQLIMKWDLPTAHTPYELRYREALTESAPWTVVPVGSNVSNVTISNLNAMSSYIVQLRCITKDDLKCVCIWGKEILVPHKLMNKPRISYNVTTQVSPGRRSVLLKWEVAQSENILGYFVNVERIPNSCSQPPHHISLKDRKILVNVSMAYYRLNISAYNEAGESPRAIYIVPEFPVTVPRTGPANVTILNITKHSALVKWTEIPAEDRLGFLQGYRISYTDSSTKKSPAVTLNASITSYHLTGLKEKTTYRVQISGFTSAGEGPQTLSQPFSTPKYDKGELEGFVIGLCFSMVLILVFAPLTCSLVIKRLKISYWHSVPTPGNSTALQDMTNWKRVSGTLLQALSDNDTTSLFVIEHESKVPLTLDLSIDGGEDNKHDTCQSEKPSNSIDMSPRHEEIPAEAVTSEEDTISMEVPLLSDYASMEFSQKALMGLAMSTPERTAHPRLKMELSSKPAQTVQKVLFASQDYLKQSQVVLLPSGPNFMGQAN